MGIKVKDGVHFVRGRYVGAYGHEVGDVDPADRDRAIEFAERYPYLAAAIYSGVVDLNQQGAIEWKVKIDINDGDQISSVKVKVVNQEGESGDTD